jgi:hypothetical protein
MRAAAEARATAAITLVETGKQRTGRECGSCSMCCKILPIDDVSGFQKTGNEWCRHCKPGKGCGIYETRPVICQGFGCLWLVDPSFSEAWKPSRSRIVVRQVLTEEGGLNVQFTVDPSMPGRWLEQPYYDDIKRVAYTGLNAIGGIPVRVYVEVGTRIILILPKKDVDVTDRAHVIGCTGNPSDWEVAQFETAEKANKFIAGVEGARNYLEMLPPAERTAALEGIVRRLKTAGRS